MSGQHFMGEYNELNGHNGKNGHNGQSNHNGHNGNALNGHKREATDLYANWKGNMRWQGVSRPYSAEDVLRLRGSIQIEYILAKRMYDRFCGDLLNSEQYVAALGALTGNQAVQQVKAGLKAIYFGGGRGASMPIWRVRCTPIRACIQQILACRASSSASIRPCSVPTRYRPPRQGRYLLVCPGDRRQAGVGGPLNVFELMKAMIKAGAASVHLKAQWPREKIRSYGSGECSFPRKPPSNILSLPVLRPM